MYGDMELIKLTNKKKIFAIKLTKETHLSFKDAQYLIEEIPFQYLDDVIEKYRKYNIYELQIYIEALKFSLL